MTGHTPFSARDAADFDFQQAVERLKTEHADLRSRLANIEEQTERLIAQLGSGGDAALLRELRLAMERLLEELLRHEQWEEEQWFPLLCEQLNGSVCPDLLTSRWVLEEDHKQAERFLRMFFEAADEALASASRERMKEAVSFLVLACSVLMEHFTAEEEMLFPLAEQILQELS